jgi:hypothetical protein
LVRPSPGPTPTDDRRDEIGELRDAYAASLETLNRAYSALQVALAEGAAMVAGVRARLESGASATQLVATGQPQGVRGDVGAGLAEVTRARHLRDRALFRWLHAEGMTAAEIGRTFGLSRALVSRLMNEPED